MEYKKISREELNIILEQHKLWLESDGTKGKLADLRYVDLRYADLSGCNLRYVDLRNANLRGCNLSNADLRYADLRYSDLRYADLEYADLGYSDLRYVDLRYVGLSNADLRGVNLNNAYLRGIDLRNIKTNNDTLFYKLVCPEEGSFIGYKKADNKLVTLEITSDAKRSSATSRKCRCSKAKVISIIDENGNTYDEVRGNYDKNFIYKVNEIAEVEDFDEDRWNECASGIHFFITKDEAWNYNI